VQLESSAIGCEKCYGRCRRTRADFAEQFEALIESYNASSRSIEDLFEELVKLSNSLNEEQQRHVLHRPVESAVAQQTFVN